MKIALRREAFRAPVVFFALASAGVIAGGQEAGEADPALVAARRRILDRLAESLLRASDRLRGVARDAAAVEEGLGQIRAAAERILEEELLGSAVVGGSPTGPGEAAGTGAGSRARHEGRFGEKRRLRIEEGGFRTEEPLRAALDWLRRHQSPDGTWECEGFAKNCGDKACQGPGRAEHDVGVTGLALLAFLGDGNTVEAGPHRETVAKGVRWLLGQQDRENGLVGARTSERFVFGHAIATAALAEVLALSPSEELAEAVGGAAAFVEKARNPFDAWRYAFPPNQENDTAVTGWMILALKAAEEAGVAVDPKAYEGARLWLDRMTDPTTGRCGYLERGGAPFRSPGAESRFPPDKSEAPTAIALLCRYLLGQRPETHPVMRQHAELLRKTPPTWEVRSRRCLVDEIYWLFGTESAFQTGGADWENWNLALKKALVGSQRAEGDEKGSWDPVGAWGEEGGRVAATAIAALCLESYFRRPRAR